MTKLDDQDDDDVLGEELPPAPGTTLLTLALCVLNVAAVLAFGYLLIMDLSARQRWAYQVFRHDLAIEGTPLKEEADGPSGTHTIAPRVPLDAERLADAFKKRTGKTVPDKFRPADLETQRIRPQDLTEEIRKDYFNKYDKNPVATLDEELDHVKSDLLKRIDTAAEEAPKKAKDAAGKRGLLYQYLLPLAHLNDNVDQVAVLDAAIAGANAAQLDELVADAAKRKLLADLLGRLEVFRPQNPAAKEDVLVRAAALEPAKGPAPLTKERYQVKTDDLAARLMKRIEETVAAADEQGTKQNDLEKRQRVAFLLFMLSRKQGPENAPLYPPGRAEAVCGVRQFTQAADTYASVVERMAKDLVPAVERDRGRYVYALDYRVHDPANFAKKLGALLDALQVPVNNKAGFQKAAEDLFTAQKGKLQTDEKETVGQKVLREVKALLQAQGVIITEDKADAALKLKVKQSVFDAAVVRLVDGYEPGFLGRHHDLVNTIRALSARIKQMDNRYKELEAQAKGLEEEYKARQVHAAGVASKVFAARDMTQKMATDLARLQDERFRAQVELADADRRNQLMARRIRELELTYKKGKGRRPQR